MRPVTRASRNVAPLAWLVVVLSLLHAQVTAGAVTPISAIRIDNFGQIGDHYYRGAQPLTRDYPDLTRLGVKTVIDLTKDGRADEQGLVEGAGMHFHRIPLTTSDRPSDGAVAEFLTLTTNPANQPVFVHCQGGRHRAGAMTAVYRITEDGWSADRAYAEMRQFKFEGLPGDPELKAFVYDYYARAVPSARGRVKPQS